MRPGVKRLVRLYYFKNGSFDNIHQCVFFSEVISDYSASNFGSVSDYLYSSLGYNHSHLMSATEVATARKEFTRNSYKTAYIKSLMKKYNFSRSSELIEHLDAIGVLGLKRNHLSDLGEFKGTGIPSSVMTLKTMSLARTVEVYLDSKMLNENKSFLELKRLLLTNKVRNIKNVIKDFGINPTDLIKVVYDEDCTVPVIMDGVLTTFPVAGLNEDRLSQVLVSMYLLGLPKVPLYARPILEEIKASCIHTKDDQMVLTMIDIANLEGCTVEQVLNSFGYSCPDPSYLWVNYSGVFFSSGDNVMYMNVNSANYVKIKADRFLHLANRKQLTSDVLY